MTILTETIADPALYEAVLKQTLALCGQPGALCVGAELVARERIRAVNLAYRGVDAATDVLSFPTLALTAGEIVDPARHPEDTDPETGEVYLGDVLLCAEIAREQAGEYGHSVERELGYLFCHALLHLLGYDHLREDERARMRAREEAVMSALQLTRGEA